jgi:hypothetical protein
MVLDIPQLATMHTCMVERADKENSELCFVEWGFLSRIHGINSFLNLMKQPDPYCPTLCYTYLFKPSNNHPCAVGYGALVFHGSRGIRALFIISELN